MFQFDKESATEAINDLIEITDGVKKNDISDGYHTFGELYGHRVTLWIAFCRLLAITPAFQQNFPVWRSKLHSDGSSFEGWFILGLFAEAGKQITYHLPMSEWENTWFADTLEQAPEFDGHTAADVLQRLPNLI